MSVISPICPKSSRYDAFSIGYIAGRTDCIMSFNRWQKLIAASTRNAVAVSLSLVAVGTLRSVAALRKLSLTGFPGYSSGPLRQRRNAALPRALRYA